MVANGNCQLFMNACTLYENYVTGQWSTAIHTGGKAIMCMNNTTIWGAAGNDDRNIVVNGDGYFYLRIQLLQVTKKIIMVYLEVLVILQFQ